ncbi:hypothetical protein ARHIZOSPH14_13090 [Agromyces rhizosphaerae]|uniref:HTH arsR-type domain-containing protein n=1 Tax=Agromyces rhizosphaerae TaxID=88374 RepID=A0A9W6CXJ2_9MICO|nr:hypothetical protein ARHIZOSPH14_13090 [Agromyces rhizosphaerae]
MGDGTPGAAATGASDGAPVGGASVDDRLDAVFAALAHPARRELVRTLARADAPLTMGRAAAAHGLSPQLLNKHAAALERAGVVRRVPRGREKLLVLDAASLAAAQQWIGDARAFWERRFDALDQYIADLEDEPA